MRCLWVTPVREPAYDQRLTYSKSFNNCCRYIKALAASYKSACLSTTVSLSASPTHYKFNERKRPLGVVAQPSTRQRGQRLPGFSCQGRTKKLLLHLKSRCVQIPGALWLPHFEEKRSPVWQQLQVFQAAPRRNAACWFLFGVWVSKELETKGKPLWWPPPSGLLFNILWELDKELTDEDF